VVHPNNAYLKQQCGWMPPRLVPLSSGTGGGITRKTCLPVGEQMASDGQLSDDYGK